MGGGTGAAHRAAVAQEQVQEIESDEELCYRSGCSLEMVRKRPESLAGQGVKLEGLPRWMASCSHTPLNTYRTRTSSSEAMPNTRLSAYAAVPPFRTQHR